MRIAVYALTLMASSGAMLLDAQAVSRPCGPLKEIASGMNVLSKLHLYFAFGERMLYVSAASSHTK